MNLHLTIGPIVSLIAGILILMMPRMLSYIVAIYRLTIGLLGLLAPGAYGGVAPPLYGERQKGATNCARRERNLA